MHRKEADKLEAELLDLLSKEPAVGLQSVPSTDAIADVAPGPTGSALRASLLIGTGVFEGREDSPVIGMAVFGGTGVFEGREDSPDVLAMVAVVHEVEAARVTHRRHACRG